MISNPDGGKIRPKFFPSKFVAGNGRKFLRYCNWRQSDGKPIDRNMREKLIRIARKTFTSCKFKEIKYTVLLYLEIIYYNL